MKKYKSQKGFTLVETSIVLIIIGIIVGIILASDNLSQAAKYRAIIADLQYYNQAVGIFNSRYNALPGDIANADSYWTGVSKGNGDGKIGIGDGSDPLGESILAWQHLSLSKIIPGSYTGATNVNPVYKAGVNSPTTNIINGFYSLYYFPNIYGKYQNALAFASVNSSNLPWANSILTSLDAYQIDTKIDDGIAYTGMLYTIRGQENNGVSTKCVSNDFSSTSSNYLFSDANISCRILYWLK